MQNHSSWCRGFSITLTLFYDDVLQFQSEKVRDGTKRTVIYYSEEDCVATHKVSTTTIKTKTTVRLVATLQSKDTLLPAGAAVKNNLIYLAILKLQFCAFLLYPN